MKINYVLLFQLHLDIDLAFLILLYESFYDFITKIPCLSNQKEHYKRV